jgi:fimbrial chaperone protein
MKTSRFLALALALSAPARGAGAFTLEPMTTLLAPSGPGSVATFRIKNEGPERVAIRLEVLSRSLSPEGRELNEPSAGLFVVYPSRVLVEPGATAVAKVQWKGPQKLDAERSFRLLAEQVSVDPAPDASSGIKMRFRYLASLYVGLGGFAPKLEASAEGAEGPDGESGFLVEIRNSGTRHVVDRDARLSISGGGGPSFELTSEELLGLCGSNYLPGTSRRLFIPKEGAERGRDYDVRLDYKDEY